MNIFPTFANHPLIPAFLVVNLVIGYWAHRQARADSFDDYATASGTLPTGVLVMTILATIVSERELSLVDVMVDFGMIKFILNLLRYGIAIFFIGLIMAPRLVFYRAPTLGGVMKQLYGKEAQFLTGIIHCLFSLFSLVTLIASIGIVSEQLLGIPFKVGVCLFGTTVVAYSTLGGMRSVSYTDVLQLVMILFVLCLVTQKVMLETGDITTLFKKVSAAHPEKLAMFSRPDFWLRTRVNLGYGLLSCYLFMSPPLVHRMLMIKDKDKVSASWYTIYFVYGVIITMLLIISLFFITHGEAFKQGDKNVFVHVVKHLFKNHPWIIDLIGLGIIGILLSTMDSFLHTMGITIIRDILALILYWLGKKQLNERQQVNSSKIGILLIGMLAVVIGSQVPHASSRYLRRALIPNVVALQTILTIPFILGVIGFKTDKRSFIGFIATYLGIFYAQKFLFPWRPALKYRADYDYFLIALPLGMVAYLLTHIYVNGGIAMVKRGENYEAHRVLQPSWAKAQERVVQWIKAIFNLPELARQEVSRHPSHALVFSIFMFALYGFSSSAGVIKGDVTVNFVMLIYFIGISLCAGLMLEGIWPLWLTPYFPLYWLATVFFCLPLGGTLAFLRFHEGLADMLLIGSFILLAFLVSSRSFLWMSFWGIGLACGGWYLVGGSLLEALWREEGMRVGMGLTILTLGVFFFGNHLETYIFRQFYLKKVFGQTVTHEVRQPLAEIALLSAMQENAVTGLTPTRSDTGERGFFISQEAVNATHERMDDINKALKEVDRDFMHFERLVSEEIGQVPPQKVHMKSTIDYIVLTLPERYKSKVKVRVECKKDFQARLIHPFFYNVLANLLINAFKHGLATEMVIQIDGEARQVRIRDNGQGIPAEVLPDIFKFHFTTGDKKNKGVGLAFVKLILDASNIKVNTISKQGEGSFTEFVLSFGIPKEKSKK